jgi:hypothetical protein
VTLSGHHPLTAEERCGLRLLIDAAARAKIPPRPRLVDLPIVGKGTKAQTPIKTRHGTETAYVAYKCHCDDCSFAASAARRRRRSRTPQ